MTGLLTATSGDLEVYGHSIAHNLTNIRQLTGVCFQQNVMFSALTVQQHLYFIAQIKGLEGSELVTSVSNIINEVGLREKANVASQALSGGMKRKLCLAMALVGMLLLY